MVVNGGKETMRIAICQTQIQFENYKANFEVFKQFVKEAGSKAELVLFPEMSLTGFSMNTEYTGENNKKSINSIIELAKNNNISIGFGWVEKKSISDKAKNHYSIISNEGCIVADYIKIHPFSFSGEDKEFVGGTSTCNFELNGIKFGVAICYDLRFPEVFLQESKNASVIIVAANWPHSRSNHWNTLMMARAIENQVYMIGVNCTGQMDGNYYSGDSQVVSPNGDVIVKITDEMCMKIIEINDDVDKIRKSFPMKNDRRESLYRTWYGE